MEQLIRDLCSVEFRSKSKTKRLIEDYTKKVREETIGEAIRKIEKIKIAVAKQTGAYKYNGCYEDCIDILNKLKK